MLFAKYFFEVMKTYIFLKIETIYDNNNNEIVHLIINL